MTDHLEGIVKANRAFADSFPGEASVRPRRQLAVVGCMDARLDIPAVLGLEPGDAHIIRNAGGIVTEDVIRSLSLSQLVLGTRSVVLVHHTDCGLEGLSNEGFADDLEAATGERPLWAAGGFSDVEEAVRVAVRRLKESPYLLHRDRIAGFVYETDTGQLRRIDEAA